MADRRVLVAYGSETGNAQQAAEELTAMLERLHFAVQLQPADSVELAALKQRPLAIVITSTTGQGELPNNAQLFWKKLLRRKLPPDLLSGLAFVVFGLGDSSYPKFNWAARKLHKRLLQLGAQEFYVGGEADEQHPEGADGAFMPWLSNLRQYMLEHFPLPLGLEPIPNDVLLSPKQLLKFEGSFGPTTPRKHALVNHLVGNGATGSEDGPLQRQSQTALSPGTTLVKGAIRANLSRNVRLTPSTHWQDVRHISLTTNEHVEYAPGDIVTIFPKNFLEDVERLVSLMGWEDAADRPLEFASDNAEAQTGDSSLLSLRNLSPGFTLRDLLISHLDIMAIPRRSFFSLIAHFTKNEIHKERLLEFTKPELIDELYDYTTRPRRSILEVLQEFESVKIPWSWAASVLPPLRGRQFSIASGGIGKQANLRDETPCTNIDLLVAIVKYRTIIKRVRLGVCTRYLAALTTGSNIEILVRPGGLHVSERDAWRPIVMVAPGTGVAPMRSLLWERQMWTDIIVPPHAIGEDDGSKSIVNVGEALLFFGGRNREADYFFRDEWDDLRQRQNLRTFPAFSRDQKHKIYVQDIIRKQADSVHRILCKNMGIVYVCGSSGKMPQAIREALIEVFQQGSSQDRKTAEAYLVRMEKEGRYKQETWA